MESLLLLFQYALLSDWRVHHIQSVFFLLNWIWLASGIGILLILIRRYHRFWILICKLFQINHQNTTPSLTLNKRKVFPFVHVCAVQAWYLKKEKNLYEYRWFCFLLTSASFWEKARFCFFSCQSVNISQGSVPIWLQWWWVFVVYLTSAHTWLNYISSCLNKHYIGTDSYLTQS